MAGRAARRFEELLIYQRARELTNVVYELSRGAEFRRDFGLVDQIRRAAVSVMSNIAEGFERGGTAEFVQFLYVAKGSCAEVRAQIQIAGDQKYVSDSDQTRVRELCEATSRMISGFIGHLQGSEYRGGKFTKRG